MERFWNKVEMIPEHPCWEWTANTDRAGCGRFEYKYKVIGAHRFSWMLHYGGIPKGLIVCHKCDNPGCVRPPSIPRYT